MKTIITGKDKKSIYITTDGERDAIQCENGIIKLWLSSGTVLGMKYGSRLYPNKWKIRILYGPVNKNYIYRETIYGNDEYGTDIFETEEEVINYRLIPNTYHNREEVEL